MIPNKAIIIATKVAFDTAKEIHDHSKEFQRLIPIVQLYYIFYPKQALDLYNNKPKGNDDVPIKFPGSNEIYAWIHKSNWRDYRYIIKHCCLPKT